MAHSDLNPYKCPFEGCGKSFVLKKGLTIHFLLHKGDLPHKCPHEGCRKNFASEELLAAHESTHVGEMQYKCPVEGCCRSFRLETYLKAHIKTHSDLRPYKCSVEGCEKSYKHKVSLLEHLRSHANEKPYKCPYEGCRGAFFSQSGLYNHYASHELHKCQICSATYKSSKSLQLHQEAHKTGIPAKTAPIITREHSETTGSLETVFTCRKCNEKYPTSAEILNHQIFCYLWCSIGECHEAFNTEIDRTNHQRERHGVRPLTKFSCFCGNFYLNEVFLKKHQERDHSPARPE